MKNSRSWLLAGAAGLLLAAVMMLLGRPAGFSAGTLLLSLAAVLGLYAAWRWAGAERALGWMMAAAFVLRLAAGLGLAMALPVHGYDVEPSRAGYLFPDAYERDTLAWELASSGQPVWKAFGDEMRVDQYGGLLALSAAVYRYLSPDLHRPALIILLAAAVSALGLAFFWKALVPGPGEPSGWSREAALFGGWLYALYPENVLLGGAQMREPFIHGLSAAAFWAVRAWPESRRPAVISLIAGLAGLAVISSRVAVIVVAVLLLWFWLEHGRVPQTAARRALLVGAGVVFAAGLTYYGAGWLSEAAGWDAVLTERSSGWVQLIVDTVGDRFRVPVVTLIGLTQPMLPGALIEPAAPLARWLSILRGAGWYFLIPLLLYAPFAALTARPEDRRAALGLAAINLVWVVVASYRAGGDMWDNPRYRTHLMVWTALLAGWAWSQARARRSAWLVRWYGVIGIFLVVTLRWYLSRYTAWKSSLSLIEFLALTAGLSALLLAGGWGWDRRRSRTGLRRGSRSPARPE